MLAKEMAKKPRLLKLFFMMLLRFSGILQPAAVASDFPREKMGGHEVVSDTLGHSRNERALFGKVIRAKYGAEKGLESTEI